MSAQVYCIVLTQKKKKIQRVTRKRGGEAEGQRESLQNNHVSTVRLTTAMLYQYCSYVPYFHIYHTNYDEFVKRFDPSRRIE